MPREPELFREEDLLNQLGNRKRRVVSVVGDVPQDQFLLSSDEELLASVEAQLHVQPLILHETAQYLNQEECQIDVSQDPQHFFLGNRKGPHYVPGTRVQIHIPFSGEAWIFRYKTSTHWGMFPQAEVREASVSPAEIIITIELPHHSPQEQFKRAYDEKIALLRQYVQQAQGEVANYNSQLPYTIRDAIQSRRQRLAQHQGVSALLNIPLQKRPGAPPLQPVRVEIRNVPRLPVAPKMGLQPEPGISTETYELILNTIRHIVRTFETIPNTCAKLEEEELRDLISASLNGHFQGEAASEVFRRNGKTDICIQAEDRAAFVGECKVWKGPAQVRPDIDQLLNYLTWRDSKAALIVFNKTVKEFTGILTSLPQAASAHSCFIDQLECSHEGEWCMQMRSAEDAGRRVIMHIFAINIFTAKGKQAPK